jgi:hypothetical protein
MFRRADFDTNHYVVVEKCRERLDVNKQRSNGFYMEGFNLKKLNEVKAKKQWCAEI